MYEAWDVVALWRELQPPISHRPFPLEILLALVAAAADLAWVDVAVLMLIGFVGCLRKSEILNLRWSDLITFREVVSLPADVLFCRIERPKMRRLGPRRQHVRIPDNQYLVELIGILKMQAAPGAKILIARVGKPEARLAWLLSRFKISDKDGDGITWASFRGAGATHRYVVGEPLQNILWLGRWGQIKTLEHYIQEFAADHLLSTVPFWYHRCIRALAPRALAMLWDMVSTKQWFAG